MASFSPFIPSPDTPYRKQNACKINSIFKGMAVGRIVLKNVHIPAITALGKLDQYGREKGLHIPKQLS
jgi:biotin synthase